MTQFNGHFLIKIDTAANWTVNNPILKIGEKGRESDTGKEKCGDGVTGWVALAYDISVAALASPAAGQGAALIGGLPFVRAIDYGADPTGVADSSAAMVAAKVALSKGGVIVLTPGIYAMNLVLDSTWTGIKIQGQGTQSAQNVPTTGYLKPYNVALPVIQFGANIASALFTTGAILADLCLYGANTGLYGLVFAGGAYRNFAENIQIFNFTTQCLAFQDLPQAIQANGLPCSYNKVRGLTISTSVAGATGIYFQDSAQTNDNYAYTTANSITDFDVTSNNGYQIWANSAQGGFLSNGYVQQQYSGLGAYFSQGYYLTPRLNFENVILDNAAGATAVTAIVSNGTDWESVTTFNSSPIQGTLQSTGPVLVVVANTTGSISSSVNPTQVTLTSTTGALAGRTVLVAGAGASGQPLIGVIQSLSGSIATLNVSASTTVAGAVTMIGDSLGDLPFPQAANNWLSSNGLFLNASNLKQLPYYAENGVMFRGGNGAIAPMNESGIIEFLGGQNRYFIADDGQGSTIASITQVGTTVTVTTNSGNIVCPGDIVKISGCTNAPGINGDWLVTARSSPTVFTYTSTASQSITASGSLTMKNNKISSWRNSGVLRIAGTLALRDQNGNWVNVLQQNVNNPNFTIATPDTTNGEMIHQVGSAITTGVAWVVFNGSSSLLVVTGYGTVRALRGVSGSSFTTAQRNGFAGLAAADIGMMVYDTTLGYPVWLHSQTGPVWHNATGAAV